MQPMNIDLRKLWHAQVLAEAQSFILAADRVGLTQSAFSRSIQVLEATIGFTLFDRDRTGTRITADGRSFLDRALPLLRDAQRLAALSAELRGGSLGEVRVGMSATIAAILQPELAIATLNDRSGIRLTTIVQSASEMLSPLVAEKLDMMICAEALVPPDAPVSSSRLVEIPAAYLARSGHPLADEIGVAESTLHHYPIIRAGTDYSGYASRIQPVEARVVCEDFSVMKAAVRATDALCIGSRIVARRELAAGELIEIDIDPAIVVLLPFALFRVRKHTPSAASLKIERMIGAILTRTSPDPAT